MSHPFGDEWIEIMRLSIYVLMSCCLILSGMSELKYLQLLKVYNWQWVSSFRGWVNWNRGRIVVLFVLRLVSSFRGWVNWNRRCQPGVQLLQHRLILSGMSELKLAPLVISSKALAVSSFQGWVNWNEEIQNRCTMLGASHPFEDGWIEILKT